MKRNSHATFSVCWLACMKLATWGAVPSVLLDALAWIHLVLANHSLTILTAAPASCTCRLQPHACLVLSLGGPSLLLLPSKCVANLTWAFRVGATEAQRTLKELQFVPLLERGFAKLMSSVHRSRPAASLTRRSFGQALHAMVALQSLSPAPMGLMLQRAGKRAICTMSVAARMQP